MHSTSICFTLSVFLISLSLLVLTGCATSRISGVPLTPPDNPQSDYPLAHVKADNSTFLLFNCLPVFSGNPRRPNTGNYDLFTDQATADGIMSSLELALKRYDADYLANRQITIRRSGWHTLGIVWEKTILAEADVMKKVNPQK